MNNFYPTNQFSIFPSSSMISLLTFTIILAFLFNPVSAKKTDLYELTIVGNAEPETGCAKLGESLGPALMDKFGALAPWLQSYPKEETTSGGRRYLKQPKSKSHLRRQLTTIQICNRKFCSRPRNFQYCYFNGCRCSCGGRRLQLGGGGNGGDVQVARKAMELMVEQAAATIPECQLGMVLTRMSVDDSEL